MRDPARIVEVCELLLRTWEKWPDQRLGQLLVNAIRPSGRCIEIFNAEEDRVKKGLERMLAKQQPTPLPPLPATPPAWKPLEPLAASTVRLAGARVGQFNVGEHFCEVLEIAFAGSYRHGSSGNPDAAAMAEQVAALLVRCEPDAVLLDLSALQYQWGDAIRQVFTVITRFDSMYPLGISVLAGPGSLRALVSLGVDQDHGLHHEPAAALEHARMQALRRTVDIG